LLVTPNIFENEIGGGPLGHPRIFINLDDASPESPAVCGYCGLRFFQKGFVKGLPVDKVVNTPPPLQVSHQPPSLPNKEMSNKDQKTQP
jgi:hypothetical protein